MKNKEIINFLKLFAISILIFFGALLYDSKSDDFTTIGGVIRNTGSGWHLIQDEAHQSLNIKDVKDDNRRVIVTFDEMDKIISVGVTADETMKSEGFSVGASVGISEIHIYIYDKDNKLVNPRNYVNEYGNIWINGLFIE